MVKAISKYKKDADKTQESKPIISVKETVEEAPKAAEPAAAVETVLDTTPFTEKIRTGISGKLSKRPGEYVDFVWALADADDIQVSHDEFGELNPKYDQKAQPTDMNICKRGDDDAVAGLKTVTALQTGLTSTRWSQTMA